MGGGVPFFIVGTSETMIHPNPHFRGGEEEGAHFVKDVACEGRARSLWRVSRKLYILGSCSVLLSKTIAEGNRTIRAVECGKFFINDTATPTRDAIT